MNKLSFYLKTLITFFLLSTSLWAQKEEAEKIRLNRLRNIISIYFQSVETPGVIGDQIRKTIKNAQDELFNQDVPIESQVKRARKIIATLFKNDETREITIELIDQEIRKMSNQIERTLIDNANSDSVDFNYTFNEILIGSGAHASAYLQAKTDASPNESILLVEQSGEIGGTFAQYGDSFFLNSTNRKYDGRRASPGQGDLNYIHDIVGLPDFDGRRWVEAGKLGQVIKAGIYLSSGLPLLNYAVEFVLPIPDSSKYRVVLVNNKTAQRITVQANRVVFSTGLGKGRALPLLNTTIEELVSEQREAYQSEIATNDKATPPQIESFDEFMRRVGHVKEGVNPIGDIIGKDIALIGFGDSSRVLAEYLTGIGPDSAYIQSRAQKGRVGRIFWFVGSNGPRNCEEYLKTSRSRYSRLAQAINSGRLILIPTKISGIFPQAGGTYTVGQTGLSESQYLTADRLSQASTYLDNQGNSIKLSETLFYEIPADARKNQNRELIIDSDTRFSKIVYAVGFESNLESILQNVLRGDSEQSFAEKFTLIDESLQTFEGETVSIARELTGSDRRILLIGTANEAFGGLPKASELKGINDNTVSLFANIERTKAAARLTPADSSLNTSEEVRKTFELRRDLLESKTIDLVLDLYEKSRTYDNPLVIETPPNDSIQRKKLRGSNIDLQLRTALDQSLRRIRFKGESLNLSLVRGGFDFSIERFTDGQVLIKIKQPTNFDGTFLISNSIKNNLEKAFLENNLLNSLLQNEILKEGSRVSKIEISVPILKSGRLDLREMEISIKRSRRI